MDGFPQTGPLPAEYRPVSQLALGANGKVAALHLYPFDARAAAEIGKVLETALAAK